jgi:hypothetical protein
LPYVLSCREKIIKEGRGRKEELPSFLPSFLGYRKCLLPSDLTKEHFLCPPLKNKPEPRASYYYYHFLGCVDGLRRRDALDWGEEAGQFEKRVDLLITQTKRASWSMRNAGFPFNAPLPPSHTKNNSSLLCSAVAFVSFYLSEKLRLILFSFEVEAHHGWEKNFGSISTEVASHAFSIFCSTDESFIRGINPPFFF